MRDYKTVHLVYFSGTGSTTRVVRSFEELFTSKGILVNKTELKNTEYINCNTDLLILFFPVYAFTAPIPVHEWIAQAPAGKGNSAAVISVSGGGEISPNTACRAYVIKLLEHKGYDVLYESMFVMPSNIIVSYDHSLCVMLLKILPHKADMVVSDILSGIRKRIKPNLIDRFISKIGNFEKMFGRSFGKNLNVMKQCDSCSWCTINCTRGNIMIRGNKPVFGNKCVVCLRCVYGCPQKAIVPRIGKFLILKEGYDLNMIENSMMQQIEIQKPVLKIPKGFIYKGVRKYLEEDKYL